MAWNDGAGQYLGQEYGGFYPDETQDVPLYGSSEAKGGAGGGLLVDTSGLNAQSSQIGDNAATGFMNNTANGINTNNNNALSASVSNGAGALLNSGMGGGGMGAVGGAVGTAATIYDSSSHNTNTGSAVLSGAASGAAAGTMIMPGIGTAIGAVVGGIIGFFGSKSAKNKEKKAFQQAEQAAVLPQQQAQANWLQKEGLMQKAIGNYASGYQPGGHQYSNSLFGGPNNQQLPGPVTNGNLPNFNVAPPNVVPGMGDKNYGIAPQSNPNSGRQQPALVAPTAPQYSNNKAANSSNIAQYQKQYMDYMTQQRQQAQDGAMQPYANITYGG